jgi:PAS domain S-box-containing protein
MKEPPRPEKAAECPGIFPLQGVCLPHGEARETAGPSRRPDCRDEKVRDRMEQCGRGDQSGRSEEKFRKLFDSATDAIFILDEQGNFIDLNRTSHERLGYTREEMLSRNVSEIDPPEFASRVPERLKELREKGCLVFESAHVRKDGSVMPVEINARIMDYGGERAVVSFIRDITVRKAAEERLRKSEEKYSNLFHQSNDAIFLHDLRGAVIDANPRALGLFGYTHPEMLACRVIDLHPPGALPDSKKAFEAIHRDGHVSFEIDFIRRDGTVFPAEVSSSIFELKGRKVILGIVRDITRRKAAEEAAREYARQLEHMNHLKELFADIMSHDLLNPAGIVYHISTMLSKKDHSRDANEIAMIQRNAQRIMRLVQDASTYARVESMDSFERVERDLVVMIAKGIESLQPGMEEKGMACAFDPPGEAPVTVNPIVEEVFENLLSNAVKYSPDGSVITVTLKERGDSWIATVADEGPGIPDEFKRTVFDRFKRRDKKGVRGSGLGLAIARRIVHLHAGRIWVEDNPGGGSLFCVDLPVRPPNEIERGEGGH